VTIFRFIFVNFISISGVTPDVFLIFVVWLAIKEDRLFGIVAGFILGLYLDFISGDVMGINAFTKTIAGFIAGGFHKKDTIKQIIDEYKFIFVVALCVIVHNIIYFLFLINVEDRNFVIFYLGFGLASAFYTTFISTFVYIFQLSTRRFRYYS
jgi:rod shape-determining protein MreD